MELRQSTEVKVRIGPFVDVTNGYEPETGITLGAADEAELLKHNGVATVDISAATWAAVTGCDGWYDLTLTTSHTDTRGNLTVVVQDDSVCLPVFCHFDVVTQQYWDSKYSTDTLEVDVVSIGGSTQSEADLKDFVDTGYDPSSHKVQGVVLADTCTTNTDMRGTDSAALAATALTNATWTDARAGYLNNLSAGAVALASTALTNATWTDAKADFLDATISSRSSHTASNVWSVGTRQLTSAQTFDLTGSISGSIGTVTALGTQAKTDVNDQVVDVLKTDTISEMSQGAPTATPTFEQAINYLYRMWRNKTLCTATELSLYDDAGTTKLAKSTISDDSVTFVKGEFVSGA